MVFLNGVSAKDLILELVVGRKCPELGCETRFPVFVGICCFGCVVAISLSRGSWSLPFGISFSIETNRWRGRSAPFAYPKEVELLQVGTDKKVLSFNGSKRLSLFMRLNDCLLGAVT